MAWPKAFWRAPLDQNVSPRNKAKWIGASVVTALDVKIDNPKGQRGHVARHSAERCTSIEAQPTPRLPATTDRMRPSKSRELGFDESVANHIGHG